MTLSQDQLKSRVAQAALAQVLPLFEPKMTLGVGTGSTTDLFIDALAPHRARFAGAVASSERSAQRLSQHGITVFDLNDTPDLPVYVDGADEVTEDLVMLKGGGGALTREKIVAAAARRFICIVDATKVVPTLGAFPLPVEVIPMARAYVCRQLLQLVGEKCQVRVRTASSGAPYVTDNGNCILDISGLVITQPEPLEHQIESLAGVVACGLFAARRADVLVIGAQTGIRTLCKADA